MRHGSTTLGAVEIAVVVLKDNPAFNAGTSSALNAGGRVEMDAATWMAAACGPEPSPP
ncbi:MAG: isoaspartyl peptidase/L-asparaginase [Acidiferrobacterales bacterium]